MAYGKLAEGNRIWDASLDLGIYFEDDNELNDQLRAMLGPREGEKIVEVGVVVSGTAGLTGGSIDLYYGDPSAGLSTTAIDGAAANPWNTGGVGTLTEYSITAAPLPLTPALNGSGWPYVVNITFLGPNNIVGLPGEARVYNAWVKTQFGN
jgi:hypothetical protein